MVLLHAGDSFEDSSDGTRVFDVIQFLIQKLSKSQVRPQHHQTAPLTPLLMKKKIRVQGPGASSFSSLPDGDIDLSSKCERLQADYDHLLHVRVREPRSRSRLLRDWFV
jgi:hypothetical protein